MSNVFFWVKCLGAVIAGAIAFSENSVIAKINQDATLTNNQLNTSNFTTVLEKHNISVDDGLKLNYIDQIQNQDRNAVEKQKVHTFTGVIPGKKDFLIAGCAWLNGDLICKP